MVSWLVHQLERHHLQPLMRHADESVAGDAIPTAADAVDLDFAEALRGEATRVEWRQSASGGEPVRWGWPWDAGRPTPGIEVVHRAMKGLPQPEPVRLAPA
jgi:hypothetical protein